MTKILHNLFDRFVFLNLKKISFGYLQLIDAKGKEHFFGNNKSFLKAKIKINDPGFCYKILRKGSSGLAESYMRGEFETEDLTSLQKAIRNNDKNTLERIFTSTKDIRKLIEKAGQAGSFNPTEK